MSEYLGVGVGWIPKTQTQTQFTQNTHLIWLAKVYERLNEPINVAIAYDQFTEDAKLQRRQSQAQDLAHAYKYLANFYLKKMKLDNAYEAASKCLEFPEVTAFFFALCC